VPVAARMLADADLRPLTEAPANRRLRADRTVIVAPPEHPRTYPARRLRVADATVS